MNCPHCGGVASPGLVACPKCGGHIVSAVGNLRGVNSNNLIAASEVKEASLTRLSIGGLWDAGFNGGVMQSQCVLFSGPPGSGKTTILLQKASLYAATTGLWAWMLSAEQSSPEVVLTMNRLELPNKDRILVLKEFGAGAELSDEAFKKYPPCFIMLDSLTQLCGEDIRAQQQIAETYKKYSVKYSVPTFLIGQMTKEFDISGSLKLQHAVDTIATLRAADNKDPRRFQAGGDWRILEIWKNRWGPRLTDQQGKWFDMTPRGFVDAPPEDPKKRMLDGEVDVDYLMSKGSIEEVVLGIEQMRGEAKDIAFEYRETITQLLERASKLAVKEPAPSPKAARAVVAVSPAKKTRAAPDKIVMPDGQELVRKPRKSTAKPATKKTGGKKPAKSNSGTKKQPKKRASR